MAGLLALLSPAGRMGARVRCRATWLVGAAAPCVPPPVFLPLLGPGPDAQLLRAARGNYQGRQYLLRLPFYLTARAGLPVRLRARLAPETQGYFIMYIFTCLLCMDPSKITATTGSNIKGTEKKKLSKSQQLKKIFQEYGAVGVSLHIGISLISLGMFYMVISSGVDMSAVLLKLGFKESLVQSKMAAGTSTFVVAYAIHKLFAPVRISITLVSVPLIVRYFRKVGIFKPPAAKP